MSKKNFVWIRTSVKKLYCIAFIFCFVYILVALLFDDIVYLWLGRNLDYPSGLVSIMCIYYCLFSFVCVSVQFINGTGKINFQLILMTILGLTNIPLSIFMSKVCGLGVIGIRIATTFLILIAAIAFPINLSKIIKREENHYESNK